MKKILMMLALVFCAQMAFCQSFDEVANKLKALPGAELLTLDKDMLKLVTSASTDQSANKMMGKLDELVMLNIENPSDETIATFLKEVKTLKNNYSKVAEEEEDGETMLVFGDLDDDGNAKGFIVGKSGKEECMLMYMKGNVSAEELEALSEMK